MKANIPSLPTCNCFLIPANIGLIVKEMEGVRGLIPYNPVIVMVI